MILGDVTDWQQRANGRLDFRPLAPFFWMLVSVSMYPSLERIIPVHRCEPAPNRSRRECSIEQQRLYGTSRISESVLGRIPRPPRLLYLARGYWEGRQYGYPLGTDQREAEGCLRRVLTDLENGTFMPPSLARECHVSTRACVPISIRQLGDLFLEDKRKRLGKITAANYSSPLTPLFEFADQPRNCRKYKHASAVDHDFAIEYAIFLRGRTVTRNGKPGAESKPISKGQIYNNLDAARSLFNWAKRPKINRVISSFYNPFDNEIVGKRAKKDPLRPNPWPLESRIRFVQLMDAWQLCHFAIPLVLPLRPEDYCGLLINEIDFDRRMFRFGFRADGHDFNKGQQSFHALYPAALEPFLRLCIGERSAGPVLQSRAVFESRRRPSIEVQSAGEVDRAFQLAIKAAGSKEVQCANDAKQVVRSTILAMGGVSEDSMGKAFRELRSQSGLTDGRMYDLRSACNTEMHSDKVSTLLQKYFTGHALHDIQAHYVSLDPVKEMAAYFASLAPLFSAMRVRAAELGLVLEPHRAEDGICLEIDEAAV